MSINREKINSNIFMQWNSTQEQKEQTTDMLHG